MDRAFVKFGKIAVLACAGALSVLSLASCATIIHGTRQEVGISSSPTGATVSIDNAETGRTPLVTKLSRRDNHIVRIQLDGYQPFEATITHGVSGWIWGNVVFGGLVGLAVDAMSGGIYKLTPEQVSGTLATKAAAVTAKGEGVYVMAVLNPEPGWVKVAQLQR